MKELAEQNLQSLLHDYWIQRNTAFRIQNFLGDPYLTSHRMAQILSSQGVDDDRYSGSLESVALTEAARYLEVLELAIQTSFASSVLPQTIKDAALRFLEIPAVGEWIANGRPLCSQFRSRLRGSVAPREASPEGDGSWVGRLVELNDAFVSDLRMFEYLRILQAKSRLGLETFQRLMAWFARPRLSPQAALDLTQFLLGHRAYQEFLLAVQKFLREDTPGSYRRLVRAHFAPLLSLDGMAQERHAQVSSELRGRPHRKVTFDQTRGELEVQSEAGVDTSGGAVVADAAQPPSEIGVGTEVVPPAMEGPGSAFRYERKSLGEEHEKLHEEARRLALLLIGEISLLNDERFREGLRDRNFYHLLKDDIERSKQIYEERVDPKVSAETNYFEEELLRRFPKLGGLQRP